MRQFPLVTVRTQGAAVPRPHGERNCRIGEETAGWVHGIPTDSRAAFVGRGLYEGVSL